MARWEIPNSIVAHELHTCERCGEEYSVLYQHFCPDFQKSRDDGYDPLRHVLQLAFDQAAKGKGKERHATDKPFLEQPIMEIARMVGPGYQLGQAMKKAQEASRLPNERARAELLGAINYLAAAYLLLEERAAV
jgi:hypothetical protein